MHIGAAEQPTNSRASKPRNQKQYKNLNYARERERERGHTVSCSLGSVCDLQIPK